VNMRVTFAGGHVDVECAVLEKCVDSMELLRCLSEDVDEPLVEWDLSGVDGASPDSFRMLLTMLDASPSNQVQKAIRDAWALWRDPATTLGVVRLWDFVHVKRADVVDVVDAAADGQVANDTLSKAVLARVLRSIGRFSVDGLAPAAARRLLLAWLWQLAQKAALVRPLATEGLSDSLNELCSASFATAAGARKRRRDADAAEEVLAAFRDAAGMLGAHGGERWLCSALAVARSVSMKRLERYVREVPGGVHAHRVLAACESAATEDAALEIARALRGVFDVSLSHVSGGKSWDHASAAGARALDGGVRRRRRLHRLHPADIKVRVLVEPRGGDRRDRRRDARPDPAAHPRQRGDRHRPVLRRSGRDLDPRWRGRVRADAALGARLGDLQAAVVRCDRAGGQEAQRPAGGPRDGRAAAARMSALVVQVGVGHFQGRNLRHLVDHAEHGGECRGCASAEVSRTTSRAPRRRSWTRASPETCGSSTTSTGTSTSSSGEARGVPFFLTDGNLRR
jgi:hypothetical protein